MCTQAADPQAHTEYPGDRPQPPTSSPGGRVAKGFSTLGQSLSPELPPAEERVTGFWVKPCPWEAPKVEGWAVGGASPKGPRGEVCSSSSSWGAAQLLPASTVTLCPGQSPFRKFSQGSWETGSAYSGAKVRPWCERCLQRQERTQPLNDLGCFRACASP